MGSAWCSYNTISKTAKASAKDELCLSHTSHSGFKTNMAVRSPISARGGFIDTSYTVFAPDVTIISDSK